MNQNDVTVKLTSGPGWVVQHSVTLNTTYLFHQDEAGYVDSPTERVPGHVFDGLQKHGVLSLMGESGTYQYFSAASDEQVMKFNITRQAEKVAGLRGLFEQERDRFYRTHQGTPEYRGAFASMQAVDRRLSNNEARLEEMRMELRDRRKSGGAV